MADSTNFFHSYRKELLSRVAEYLSGQGDFRRVFDVDKYCNDSNETEIWKGSVFVEERFWSVYFLFGKNFPVESPIVISPDAASLYLVNPHILEGGYLCILPEATSVDNSSIEDLLSYYLYSVRNILAGTLHSDFRDEFSCYWNRRLSSSEKNCLIVSSPEVLEEQFYVLWSAELICISKDEKSLSRWWNNYIKSESDFKLFHDGITINLDSPLAPSEYPENCFDLLELIKKRNAKAYSLISDSVVADTRRFLVLLKQKTDNGYCLGCVELKCPNLNQHIKSINGFRPGHIPKSVLLRKAIGTLKYVPVFRYGVIRVDYDWIHSRGGDGRNFANKSIAIIGCGSMGGYIAHILAKSGIGKLLLIDKEKLEWANIGRHILGAIDVGEPKSDALKKRLLNEMPHLEINSLVGNWLDFYESDGNLFTGYDAIIVSIADWNSERILNDLVLKHLVPTVLFTWLEPYALAGHCFISSGLGCLNCHMNRLGRFIHAVSVVNMSQLKREPGGCTFYQPYGTSALLNAVAMSSRMLLKQLQKPVDSTLYSWVSDEDHYNSIGATISDEWVGMIKEKGYSRIFEQVLASTNCELCRK